MIMPLHPETVLLLPERRRILPLLMAWDVNKGGRTKMIFLVHSPLQIMRRQMILQRAKKVRGGSAEDANA